MIEHTHRTKPVQTVSAVRFDCVARKMTYSKRESAISPHIIKHFVVVTSRAVQCIGTSQTDHEDIECNLICAIEAGQRQAMSRGSEKKICTGTHHASPDTFDAVRLGGD